MDLILYIIILIGCIIGFIYGLYLFCIIFIHPIFELDKEKHLKDK